MEKTLLLFALAVTLSCTSPKVLTKADAASQGDTRTAPAQYIDDNTYLLVQQSSDKSYGYEKSNPIKVGGAHQSSGPKNERRFLNALLGPNGEEIMYARTGSCCHFKTPNGLFDNTGMLDTYKVHWTGGKDTLLIYINMYDEGDLHIPVGLTGKKKK